ncbi:MAG: DUF975 family protein [Eubacteriales bacterium]|nr:DUF975 family protein [Eubacteriales bacterium]
MFNRKVLKDRAKSVLATSYWPTLAIVLVYYAASTIIANFFTLNISSTITLYSTSTVILYAGIILIRILMSFAATILLTYPLLVGVNKYLLEQAKGTSPQISEILYAFRSNYSKIVCTVLAKQLVITLLILLPMLALGILSVYLLLKTGYTLPTEFNTAQLERLSVHLTESPAFMLLPLFTILITIPALIKVYDYYLVEYIIAEDSDISWREALRKSKNMMKGNRFATFVLGLSFIGWTMLGVFLCGIGSVFVIPYIFATDAQLYLELSGKTTYEPRNDFEF